MLAAVAEAARARPGLPLIAGGQSFGGRMTSQAAAAQALPGVRGLAFLGFPLHPPKKPSAAPDHSFGVLRRSGRTADDVIDELAAVTAAWAARLPA